ncbi:MAG: HAD-IA family hydrolase [Coriobacteriia bacterium]|nr:HAD-IA family hydrolase [Coriobacteriia bacterium]
MTKSDPVNVSARVVERLGTLQAVLFDLDGTVVDTIPHILASFRHATADVLGEALPDDVLMHHVGVPLARQMRFFTDDEDTAERLLASYRAFNHATHDEMARLYPNTLQALESVAASGLPMGIVTSKSSHMAWRALELFDLGRFFAVVVTADDTTVHKPDPTPVLLAAAEIGVDPGRCVYVGDSPADIAAARGAGAIAVGATWGVADKGRIEQAGPDAVIDDIGSLPALLGLPEAPTRAVRI